MMLLCGLATKKYLRFQSWPRLFPNWRKLISPKYAEFEPRTVWSLSNAFTSAFKELDPIPQFRATAKLGAFLDTCFKPSF